MTRTIKQPKIKTKRQLLEDLQDITWFDNGSISIGIDWMTNTMVVADIEHPDGATIEIGTFSDLRAI